MTLDEGRIRTWRLPAFSALFMALRASLRTEVLTILAVENRDSQIDRREEMRYLFRKCRKSQPPLVFERKECPFLEKRSSSARAEMGMRIIFDLRAHDVLPRTNKAR